MSDTATRHDGGKAAARQLLAGLLDGRGTLTVADVARRAGVSAATLKQAAAGRHCLSLPTLIRLARALGYKLAAVPDHADPSALSMSVIRDAARRHGYALTPLAETPDCRLPRTRIDGADAGLLAAVGEHGVRLVLTDAKGRDAAALVPVADLCRLLALDRVEAARPRYSQRRVGDTPPPVTSIDPTHAAGPRT